MSQSMMEFSILWCVRKGRTQFVCKCCSLCDLLQAIELSQPNHVHHEASQTAPQIPTFVSLWTFKAFIGAWRDRYVLLQTIKAAKAGNSLPSSLQRPCTQPLNATGFARGSCIISSPIFSPKPTLCNPKSSRYWVPSDRSSFQHKHRAWGDS